MKRRTETIRALGDFNVCLIVSVNFRMKATFAIDFALDESVDMEFLG